MAYFQDNTDYVYGGAEFCRIGTKNIGWLEKGRKFETKTPSTHDLELVWEYCKVSVAQTRGWHACEFCDSVQYGLVVKESQRLLLGTSEIRVFGSNGVIYASPTLMYHYMQAHSYSPPNEFLDAMRNSPRPPTKEYFDRLDSIGLKWRNTSSPDELVIRRLPSKT
jgi:hypothetical protein